MLKEFLQVKGKCYQKEMWITQRNEKHGNGKYMGVY